MRARRALAALVGTLVLSVCTSSTPAPSPTPSTPPASRTPVSSSSPTMTPTTTPAAGGLLGPSAARELTRLCPNRAPGGSTAPAEGPAPPIVATVEHRVERIRGLTFTQHVPVRAVTHAQLVRGLSQTFDAAYPAGLYRRKSLAWATIGAIPAETEIRHELEAFASTQVIGYYDEVSKYLVFLGARHPTPAQVVTLAHELTHALDDQHFGLLRLDQLSGQCDDEGFEAALALAEGDATYVMTAYAQRYLSLEQQLGIVGSGSASPDVAPFVLRLETWPYTAGEAFVQTLVTNGGETAVDRAFRHLPVSTAQILHPASYPNESPVAVDIPELAPRLGAGWHDLDVQGVGEAWLATLLGLRLDPDRASAVTDGWKGGAYRAWTSGPRTAVELRTAWRDPTAAAAFATAMRAWLASGHEAAIVEPVSGADVTVLFGSNAGALAALRAAAS